MSYRQNMAAVSRVYVLPRCTVSLWQTGADNALGALVWTAKSVDNLRVSERFDEVWMPQTGCPYPEPHHLGETHELTFDAIWNVGARLQRNTKYILEVLWEDANFGAATLHWVRRFYIGATLSSRDLGSRDGNEFGSSNIVRAQYCVETEADGAPTPSVVGDPTC